MKISRMAPAALMAFAALLLNSCTTTTPGLVHGDSRPAAQRLSQTPTWSKNDMQFFLHGTMSTEFVPENLLRAFVRANPDLFPKADLSHFGLIPDPSFGWPIGFSRRTVPHLAGLPAVGVNCASCHSAEIVSASGDRSVRVLGVTSHIDAEAFFGAILVSTFRTADPANMEKVLAARVSDAGGSPAVFKGIWAAQQREIIGAMTADPFGAAGVSPGEMHSIQAKDLEVEGHADLLPAIRATLKLCHNIRAAVHVPDQPPEKAPPASGPGRNDAFGLLSLMLLGQPQPYGPVKYGLVWNLEKRHWVHWDGNTQSPIGRNLLASLGLGAALSGNRGQLEFAKIQRQTALSERIQAPRYPFAIDAAAARRGGAHYQARCASCHDGPETDQCLHSPDEIGTDPGRARFFTAPQAAGFNAFLAKLEAPGYTPSKELGIRATQKYLAPRLAGVWARSPYLHNGSVRTMEELLSPNAARAKTFRRGSKRFDEARMGYTDEGAYVLDTTQPGNGNSGHNYGQDLSDPQRHELIEYLKTL